MLSYFKVARLNRYIVSYRLDSSLSQLRFFFQIFRIDLSVTVVVFHIFFADFPQHTAGIAHGDHIGRNILHHHAARADHAVLSDGDAGADGHVLPDPHVVADGDRIGVHVPLRKGDAIFVNSGRLHFGYSEKAQECHYGYAVFHPDFLGYNSVIVSILERLASDGSPDYFVFTPDDEDGQAAIEAIRYLPGEKIPESETGNPFQGLDIDGASAPLYRKKPIPDFFRLADEKNHDKWVYCLKLPESQVMRYCRDFDATPNVFAAVMLAKAARRYDPDSAKTITVSVCVNLKTLLGNKDNYRCFAGEAVLDFPKNRALNDISKACTIARGQLMLQAQPENALWALRQMKRLPPPSPDIPQASICVSYTRSQSFGPLEPWIEELYMMTSLSKITDILLEITCVNHSFFFALLQPFSSDGYFRCFLEELTSAGIDYEVLRGEPLRMCGI